MCSRTAVVTTHSPIRIARGRAARDWASLSRVRDDRPVTMSSEDIGRSDDFVAMARLAESFAGLVDAFTERRKVPLRAADLVAHAHRVMPRSEHASLTVRQRGQARTIAATGPTATRLDEIRAEIRPHEGPVLDVLEGNDGGVRGDLGTDPRWPAFGHRVLSELETRSLVSYRLYLAPDHRAALTFLSSWPYAFDQVAVAIGAIFAAYCSLILLGETVFGEQVGGLRTAEVHREIGVAVGILLTSEQLSIQDAYLRLLEASHKLGTSLQNLAGQVIEHGGVPPDRPSHGT